MVISLIKRAQRYKIIRILKSRPGGSLKFPDIPDLHKIFLQKPYLLRHPEIFPVSPGNVVGQGEGSGFRALK